MRPPYRVVQPLSLKSRRTASCPIAGAFKATGCPTGFGQAVRLWQNSDDSLKFWQISWASGACSTRDPPLYTHRSRKMVREKHRRSVQFWNGAGA